MPNLTKQLTLPCANGKVALEKLRKLMKRGFTDDNSGTDPNSIGSWNTKHASYYSDSSCYVIVHTGGAVLIVGHDGDGNMISRVRDVEQYYA